VRKSVLAAFAAAAYVSAFITPVHAQQVTHIRGTITAVGEGTVEIALRDGSKVTAELAPHYTVGAVSIGKITDIKPDSYIGTAAVPQPDGTLKAIEIHVFDPSMRGSGEGTRPWDAPGPTNSMTNGTVGSVIGTTGRTLHVTYKGGEKDVVVPPDVPIVTLAPGSPDMIKPGAKVMAFGTRAPDGKVTVERMSVGMNGIAPPM
jgi:hypothetical protein